MTTISRAGTSNCDRVSPCHADLHGSSAAGRRLLFCSYHSYVDPSSGAAQSTRDLLALLAARGWQCRVLCGPHLDCAEGPSLEQLLAAHALPCEVRRHTAGPLPFAVYHCRPGNVPVALYAPAHTDRPAPSRAEGQPFLALVERVLDRFQPDLLLTYGGHWLARAIQAAAKARGVAVVFALHNLDYRTAETFRQVDAVLVPSRWAQEHYWRTLNLASTAIPGPWDWVRVRCRQTDRRYVTFVNPQPHKGVLVFARIAAELGRRRPDIPLLVVEGRGQADGLRHTGLDLGASGNVHVMAHTPDPRAFYQVSRLLLVPSLCQESLGRVAVEALINGIPVLASRRGALTETLAEAGFLFEIPKRYTPAVGLVPSAEEVAPWVETIIRLWDDAAFYEREQQRCLAAAEAWRPERLAPRFEAFFATVLRTSGRSWEAPLAS
ncbi:MAG: glycosyltransferase [Gemmataceae bacterium]|nr:glycosyltransferase [Gemmataceae bacterium]